MKEKVEQPALLISNPRQGSSIRPLHPNCVLEKPFVKNPNQPMQEYVDYVAAKLGDRIKIDQHIRFQAGEAMSDAAAGT